MHHGHFTDIEHDDYDDGDDNDDNDANEDEYDVEGDVLPGEATGKTSMGLTCWVGDWMMYPPPPLSKYYHDYHDVDDEEDDNDEDSEHDDDEDNETG